MNCAFTIASRSYLPMALALGDSVRETNPDLSFVIFLFEDATGHAGADVDAAHRVVDISGLDLDGFSGMRERYDDFELSCAMKPAIAEYLLASRADVDKVYYIDSDTRFFAPLARADAALDRCAILLTPHVCSPYPDDGRKPALEVILGSGLYNAGFWGISRNPESARFLKWWKGVLAENCRIDLRRHRFVDQNWLNFVPLFFDRVHVFRDPGYNVAYWNLHERPLGIAANGFLAAGEPLVLFHFSGYRMDQPRTLSRYQDRFDPDNDPVLASLCEHYRDGLERHGFQGHAANPAPQPARASLSRRLLSRFARAIRAPG